MSERSRVVSVNVGAPRDFEMDGKTYSSAIWKYPAEGRLEVAGVNIAGDDQADRIVHGGHDKAIYAYALEDYDSWERELGRPLEPGTFGENLTVAGIDVNSSLVGERWRVGVNLFEVRQPRLPCFKLGVRMEDRLFPHRFSEAARWGAYLAIIAGGSIGAGDAIEVVDKPDHAISIGTIAHIYFHDHSRAAELLAVPGLPDGWRAWAEKRS